MNIFNKVALQGLKKNRTRSLVTIIGVALSAAMITAVSTFAVSLQNYMVNGAMVKYGSWHVGFLDVPYSFVQEKNLDKDVQSTTSFENIGYAELEGGKNPNKPYLFIAGFSKETFETLPITLVSGRLPENSREILVPAHVEANGGVKYSVGDTLSLNVGSRKKGSEQLNQHNPYVLEAVSQGVGETLVPKVEQTYTVVGICQRPSFEEYTAPGYTLITITDDAKVADTTHSFSTFIVLKNPRQVHSYVNHTAGSYDYILNDEVLRFMGLSDDHTFNGILYSVGGILIVLIMVGSIFLIYNAFTISLSDRMRQLGILLSVGATQKQLRHSVLFEGLCIGVVGIPIGILIGIPSIKFVLLLVAKNFANILYDTVPLTLHVSIWAIIIAAMISMITILISAYIPARKAVSAPVMECIRQTREIKVDSKSVKTPKWAKRIYGLEGTLALKNFKRNKRRYRSVVLSLTLSVILLVSASTFEMYLKKTTEQFVVVNTDFDICFCTKDMEEEQLFQLYDKLKNVDGVYESSYQTMSAYLCPVKASELSDDFWKATGYDLVGDTMDLTMNVQFIEDSIYFKFIESLGLSPNEYTGQNAKIIAAGKVHKVDEAGNKKDGKVDIFKNRVMNFGITPKGGGNKKNIEITFVDTVPLEELPREVTAVTPYCFLAVAPYQMKAQFETPEATMGLTFRSQMPSQSVKNMEKVIASELVTSQYTLYNLAEIFEQAHNIIFIVDLFTIVFVVMMSLIATANVFNTISTNIRLRRRELAMLRSIGMSDCAFNKMMCFECAFYGIRTLLVGLPIAVIFSWMIYEGMIIGGAEIGFIFPWGSIGVSICGVFIVIFITMLYAVRKIRKENIIDALRDEMS